MLLLSIATAILTFASAPTTTARAIPVRPNSAAVVAPETVSTRAAIKPTLRSAPVSVRLDTVAATIKRAVAAWSRVKTLRATFEQTLTNPITGSALTSKGELQQQKPNKLAITFSDPAGDRIVADGEYVWVYLRSATPGQVVRLSNTDIGAASTDLIGQFLNTPRGKYDATDAGMDQVGNRRARALILLSKPGETLPFVRAKVWVDQADGLIRQFESTDGNGITRRVRLLTLSPNAKVDARAFIFVVPKDVRVVER